MGGAAGCGGGDASLAPSTAPLEEGTEVSPQRYLADTTAAAEAVNAFSARLRRVGAEARVPALRRAAPDLEAAYERTARIADRLEAARLRDTRLERQRAEAAVALQDVVGAMSLVVVAARRGAPADAENAATGFTAAVAALRGLSTG